MARVTYTDRTRDEDNNAGNNTANNDPPFVGFTEHGDVGCDDGGPEQSIQPEAGSLRKARGPSGWWRKTLRRLTGDTDDDDAEIDNPDDNVGGGPVIATDDDLRYGELHVDRV